MADESFPPRYIVCKPESAGPSHIRGSILKRCVRCMQSVHVGPASVSFLKTCEVLCVYCAMRLSANAGTPVIGVSSEAHRREISEAIGREVSREEMQRMARDFDETARFVGELLSKKDPLN